MVVVVVVVVVVVDTSYELEPPATSYPFPAIPHTAGPITTGFNNLFNDLMSPTGHRSFESPVGPQHKKHHSHSPGTTHNLLSLSSIPVSSLRLKLYCIRIPLAKYIYGIQYLPYSYCILYIIYTVSCHV